jgi:hypothetical protein
MKKIQMKSKSTHILDHQLIETLLLLDEVSCFVDARHEFVELCRPIVQHLRLALLLCEVDDARRPVDLHLQRTIVDELGEEFFGFEFIEVEEFRHALDADACVVVGDDADVLLGEFHVN